MDYFQGVVTEYLRANRSTFVNTEYLIQLDHAVTPTKDRHWYCDALAVNFEHSTVYLCEVTYSKTMGALISRLSAWAANWDSVCAAIARDSKLGGSWRYQPWVFIPADARDLLARRLSSGRDQIPSAMPTPRVDTLESVAPWNYCSWDRAHSLGSEDSAPG